MIDINIAGLPSLPVSELEQVSRKAIGLYFLYSGDELVYIGQSRSIRSRLLAHKRAGNLCGVTSARWWHCQGHWVREILVIEKSLIRKYRPSCLLPLVVTADETRKELLSAQLPGLPLWAIDNLARYWR